MITLAEPQVLPKPKTKPAPVPQKPAPTEQPITQPDRPIRRDEPDKAPRPGRKVCPAERKVDLSVMSF